MIGSLILAGVALYGYLNLEGVPAYASLVCTGLFIGPSHTLFMVAGQRQFPQRMAMVSGVFLGFVFISGGIGAWLLGLAADRIGLGAALSVLPWSLWAGAICALVAVPRGVARQAPQRSESVAAESSG
ncbi:MAG: hypothetical protein H5U01_14195 [Clostridia bacterium]|nr:hypothetical protein [Clostridia bacterium]